MVNNSNLTEWHSKRKFAMVKNLIKTTCLREEEAMKKRFGIVFAVMLCIMLSACGSNDYITGEVVEATPSALIVEQSDGKRVAVLLEEDTYIWGTDEFNGEDYKAAPYTGVQVGFYPNGRADAVVAADGTEVKTYHTESFVHIEAWLSPETAVLSDGTELHIWKTSWFGTMYQTADGVELLREEVYIGPENHYAGNTESFDDLSETAKDEVREFYEKQGKLYDLQAELERAWKAYQEDSEHFCAFMAGQETTPAASSEQMFYFTTHLTRTISGNTVQTTPRCDAFDRESGEYIPLAELFVCPETDVIGILLDLAEKEGSGPADAALQAEMEAAFRMEYLGFSQNEIWIEFPAGVLPGEEYTYLVSVAFTDECKSLLHPWAVPYQVEQ